MSKGLKTSLGSHGGAIVGCYNDVQYGLSPVELLDNPSNIIKGSERITLSGVVE
jgi:hypothetical protein